MNKNKLIITVVAVVILCLTIGIIYTATADDGSASYVYEEETSLEETYSSDTEVTTTEAQVIYVYVCGQVNSAGVIATCLGARVYEAIELAGGFTETADVTAVNQAEFLTDGQQIYIPAIGEVVTSNNSVDAGNGLININTAGVSELMELPGVGQSRAESIIQYREDNGAFSSIEDIMNISGIKEASFEKIKDMICV